jgi:anaerobic selenocysteine-containing dehydrogenase
VGATAARTPPTIMRAVVTERPALAGASYKEMDRLGVRLRRPARAQANGAHANREPSGEGLRLVTTRRIFGDAFSMRSDALAHVRQPADVVISPNEAERLGLSDGDRARLVSEHGECVLPVRVSGAHQDGVAFAAAGVPGAGVERLLPADDGPVRVQLTPA